MTVTVASGTFSGFWLTSVVKVTSGGTSSTGSGCSTKDGCGVPKASVHWISPWAVASASAGRDTANWKLNGEAGVPKKNTDSSLRASLKAKLGLPLDALPLPSTYAQPSGSV